VSVEAEPDNRRRTSQRYAATNVNRKPRRRRHTTGEQQECKEPYARVYAQTVVAVEGGMQTQQREETPDRRKEPAEDSGPGQRIKEG